MKLRVVLDSVRIMNDRDPAMQSLRLRDADRGTRPADTRLHLDVRVHTRNHGGVEQHIRLPRERYYKPRSLYSIRVEEPIFEGDVEDHLAVRIAALPHDADGPEEAVDSYTREFEGDPQSWLGRYGPQDASGPEHLGFWQVYYHIEAPDES